ncbi:MAG: hypothetical protein KAS96_11545 [Planctomycetes bacterium]|nr:hypothetical protein [Planctomycetota bacterium]
MNTNKVCGEFPEFCYKAFKCKEHAEDFIQQGTFRMGCQLSYKAIEDKSRCDPTEDYGHTKEPGIVTVGWVSPNPAEKTIWTREQGLQEHHSELGNPIFCFCTCLPDVDPRHMSKIFGKYIVTINDPKQLTEDINDYFISDGRRFLIVGCKVVYNKGQKLEEKLGKNERLDMAYKQKPESFSPDCEFRIVAIKLGEPCKEECKFISKYFDEKFEPVEPMPDCNFIEVNLGRQLEYLSFVT